LLDGVKALLQPYKVVLIWVKCFLLNT
jgi:hypothetical protein